MNTSKKWTRPKWPCFVLAALLAATPLAIAQTGFPGDVNLDGAINVLDVQNTINMALGLTENASEADVDENLDVDVLDIQTLTNTVLGVGGLVQRVIGVLDLPADPAPGALTIVALSRDGRRIETAISGEDGAFELLLPVHTSWGLGFFSPGASPASAGSLTFPVSNVLSGMLPLLSLSSGAVLDLGVLSFQQGISATPDLRTLLARIADPLSGADADVNGLPDFIDSLLNPLSGASLPVIGDLPDDFLSGQLGQWLVPCLEPAIGQVLIPDISGIEAAGIPALLQPAWHCIESSIVSWIQATGLPLQEDLVRSYAQTLMTLVTPDIPEWLNSLQRPELSDQNSDGIPDYLDGLLCTPQSETSSFGGGCPLDLDLNGMLDFLEDSDGDGIPNGFDMDNRTAGDRDGDGIADIDDVDDDGDGIPDYADND